MIYSSELLTLVKIAAARNHETMASFLRRAVVRELNLAGEHLPVPEPAGQKPRAKP